MPNSCRLCGSKDNIDILDLNYCTFDDVELDSDYKLIQCKSCSFVYCNTESNEYDFYKYYKNNLYYTEKIQGVNAGDLYRYKSIANFVSNIVASKDATIVEIGCGTGGVLQELSNFNYTNLFGIDPISNCLDSIDSNRIKTQIGTSYNTQLTNKYADCVIFSHVMEHIVDINSTMIEINRILKNNGVVIVEVPNVEEGYSFDNSPLWDMIMEHINYFSSHTLKTLFQFYGFNTLAEEKDILPAKFGKIHTIRFAFSKSPSNKTRTFIPSRMLNIKNEINLSLPMLDNVTEPCALLSVSSYTQLLLGITNLKHCNITIVLDDSKFKQSKTINGLPIVSLNNISKDINTVIFPENPYSSELNSRLDDLEFTGNRLQIYEKKKQ